MSSTTYAVKCDECKQDIRRTDSMRESAEGGTCDWCKQKAYYRLCDEARELGIPTSLDDPRSPKTVDELRGAIARAKFDAWEMSR